MIFSQRKLSYTIVVLQKLSYIDWPNQLSANTALYMDKPAGDLLWKIPRLVWEYLYSDQWETSNITRLIHVDQSQVLELTQRADILQFDP